MSNEYKTSYNVYSAWNYQKEIEDLNAASEQGWQLVRGGCFHSRFVKNPDIRYRYQLDYGKIEDMGRYIELFREQGWEYINSTFNGWHYFRKLYDPSQPEEEYEIFTDRESLREMNNRWARIALAISIFLGLFAVIDIIRIFRIPTIPRIIQFLLFVIESAVLLRGWMIMRNPESSRSRKGDSTFLTVFFAVLVLGFSSYLFLDSQRPCFSSEQQADSADQPIIDNRWVDFDVRYGDNYYLDLDMEAEKPMTFAVINEAGEEIFTVKDTNYQKEDIRLKLEKGHYWFSMSSNSGFRLNCSIE